MTTKILYPALTQALQETQMTLHPGQNSNSWQPAWNNGKTRTIRVPVRLADDILAYARDLDSGSEIELFPTAAPRRPEGRRWEEWRGDDEHTPESMSTVRLTG